MLLSEYCGIQEDTRISIGTVLYRGDYEYRLIGHPSNRELRMLNVKEGTMWAKHIRICDPNDITRQELEQLGLTTCRYTVVKDGETYRLDQALQHGWNRAVDIELGTILKSKVTKEEYALIYLNSGRIGLLNLSTLSCDITRSCSNLDNIYYMDLKSLVGDPNEFEVVGEWKHVSYEN